MFTVRKYLREHNSLVEAMTQTTDAVLLAQLQEQIVAAPTKQKALYPKRAFTKQVEQEFYKIIKISEERDKLLGINKQYLTATKIHKELRRKGFNIGLSTVSVQYSKYKQEVREAFIKQEYDPGVRAEYDFHQVKLYVEGKVVRYYQATIALPYSNYYFIRLYKNEKMESVVDSIVQFYNHCNGVCKEMVFDNMSTVVKRFLYSNKNKEYTEEILRLSNYYGFEIVTCNAARGNEKGTVENGGNFIRNELFSLNYKFDLEEDIKTYYLKELEELNKKAIPRFQTEQLHFLQLPVREYNYCKQHYKRVSTYSLIQLQGNYYSVPDTLIGEKVKVHESSDTLLIYNNDTLVSQHKKIDGTEKYSVIFEHYLRTFSKKPAAITNSLALKQLPEKLQSIYKTDYIKNPRLFIQDLFMNQNTLVQEEIQTTCINQLEEMSNYYA